MINPITQLKQRKGTETAINRTQGEDKGESKATIAPNAKTLSIIPYPQMTRQFKMLADSVENCKNNFPDCFHHKLHTAKECKSLATRLAVSVKILQKIRKNQPLDDVSEVDIKQATHSSRYLIRQFESIIQEVERVATEGKK